MDEVRGMSRFKAQWWSKLEWAMGQSDSVNSQDSIQKMNLSRGDKVVIQARLNGREWQEKTG